MAAKNIVTVMLLVAGCGQEAAITTTDQTQGEGSSLELVPFQGRCETDPGSSSAPPVTIYDPAGDGHSRDLVLFCVNATYVYGLGGNDFIITRGSDDKLYGGPGRDHMRAGGGNDLLDGGIGADYMVGGAGNDAYIIDDPDDAVIEFAGGGYDKVVSSTNYTSSIFYLEEIELAAGSVAVKIQGQRSDEVLRGNEKDNEIFGAWGNDTLYGGEGRDYLMGGYSSDVLTGGAGADRFVLGLEYGNAFDSTYAGIDTVMDFNLSEDRLLLVKSTFSKLGGELSFATVTSDALAETSSFFIVYNSSNGKLFYNQNGAAAGFGGIYGGHFATLTGKPALQAGHFELVP